MFRCAHIVARCFPSRSTSALMLLCGFFLVCAPAYAADSFLCADDDNNGTIDILKTAGTADRDCDGQTADNGSGGGDCDDVEWRIFAGQYTAKGCSVGQWKQCDPAGSAAYLAACTATVLAERGTNYYINGGTAWNGSGAGNDANAGTWAAPFASFAPVTKGGAHEAGADTAIYLIGTTDIDGQNFPSGSGSTEKIIFASNHAGTSAGSPNLLRRYPGATAKLAPSTSITHQGPGIRIFNSFWDVSDFEYTGGYGVPITTNGANNVRIYGNYIHDVSGDYTTNLAGIRLEGDSFDGTQYSNNDIHHNIVNNIFDTVQCCQLADTCACNMVGPHASDRENINAITIFAAQNNKVRYNRVGSSFAVDTAAQYYKQMGMLIKEKHSMYYADVTAASQITGNILYNGEIACIEGGMPKLTITGNLGFNCNGVRIFDTAGCAEGNVPGCYEVDGTDIENNTIDGGIVSSNSGAGRCLTLAGTPSTNPSHAMTISNNVCYDSTGLTYTAGSGVQMFRLFNGAGASLITAINTYLTTNGNCYYSTNSLTALTNGFYNMTAALAFGAWQAALRDIAGFAENLTLDPNLVPTSMHCTSNVAGWSKSWPTAASSSSSSSVAGTTAVSVMTVRGDRLR